MMTTQPVAISQTEENNNTFAATLMTKLEVCKKFLSYYKFNNLINHLDGILNDYISNHVSRSDFDSSIESFHRTLSFPEVE